MGTRRRPARAVLETLHCDYCETEMEYTGEALASNPMQYVHKCPNEKCPAEMPKRYVRVTKGGPLPRVVHEVDE
jgi:hypothetical protein